MILILLIFHIKHELFGRHQQFTLKSMLVTPVYIILYDHLKHFVLVDSLNI